jgi:hypothetical protein
VAGSCELGNELSVSIKCRESLYWLSDCQLINKNFSACNYISKTKRAVRVFIDVFLTCCVWL